MNETDTIKHGSSGVSESPGENPAECRGDPGTPGARGDGGDLETPGGGSRQSFLYHVFGSPGGGFSLLVYLVLGLLSGIAAAAADRMLIAAAGLVLVACIFFLLPGPKKLLHWMMLFFWGVLPLCGLAFLPALSGLGSYLPMLVTFLLSVLLLLFFYNHPGIVKAPSLVTLPFWLSLGVYTAALLLSVLVAAHQPVSLLLSFRALLVLLVFFLLLGSYPWKRRQVESILWLTVCLGVMFGLAGLATAFLGDISVGPFALEVYEYFYEVGLPRISSVFGNPNSLAIYLLYSLAATSILAALMLCRRPLLRQNILFLLIFGVMGIQLLALLFTFSRSSFLALAVFAALFVWFNFRSLFYLGVVLCIPAVAFAYTAYSHILQEFLRISRLFAGREAMWSDGVELFGRSPLLGIGLGGWQVVTDWGVSVHNTYLRIAMELGAVGLLAYLGLVFSLLFIMVFRMGRLQPGTPRYVVLSGIVSLTAGLLAVKFFEVFFIGGTSFIEIYLVFLLSLGLGLAYRPPQPGQQKDWDTAGA